MVLIMSKPSWMSAFLGWKPRSNARHIVNCWFCNEDTDINIGRVNKGWICPSCEQYNGFKEDGDFDHPIKEQYEETEKTAFCRRGAFTVRKSILCPSCEQNQVLKVGQLASFVPLSESCYEQEVESYRQYLESVYRLCRHCKDKVKVHLDRQDQHISEEFDQDSGQVKDGVFDALAAEPVIAKSGKNLYSVLFGLCLLMALLNGILSAKPTVQWTNGHDNKFYAQYTYFLSQNLVNLFPLSAVQQTIPFLVFSGTAICVLGLALLNKACIYIADAMHIVLWLLLVIFHTLKTYPNTPNLVTDVHGPVYLTLSLLTVATCFVCLKMSRLPRNVSLSNFQMHRLASEKQETSKEENNYSDSNEKNASQSPSSMSPVLLSVPPSPSPSHIGEACNFFKPISSSPVSSRSSVSSASPDVTACPDQSKNPFDTVRDHLESFSLGLARKSASVSNIWSLPSIVSSDPKASPIPIQGDSQQTNVRNILSPSRLSFLSLSSSPSSSPGPFSSSNLTSDSDSEFIPDSCQHQLQKNQLSPGAHLPNNPNFTKSAKEKRHFTYSTSSEAIPQGQSFTKYRSNSKIFSANLDQFESKLLSLCDERKVVAVPDSTSNSNCENTKEVKNGPRRSERIAMRGKIIKPWPLKKSLSLNNMYDSQSGVDFLSRDNKGVEQSSHKGKKTDAGVVKRFRAMEKISELSDSEDMDCDGPWNLENRRVMRGESSKKTESKWRWAALGLVVGISVTANFFLLWIVWTDKAGR